MAGADSRTRKSKGLFLDLLDSLSRLGLQIGGLIFAGSCIYLLWGVFSGSLTHVSALGQQDQARIWENVEIFCEALTISGLVLLVSAMIRFYSEEITGYVFLITGAAFYWGFPMLVGSALQARPIVGAGGSPVFHIVSQFQLIGVVALVLAVPLIMADFLFKLRGVQRPTKKGAVTVSKETEQPRSRLYLFCWQMPYCRDYLRKYCKAYEQRKSCWRLKSGCYCDEDLILRVMKKDGAKATGFDQRFSAPTIGARSKQLTAAQKRQRCRECFLYTEHQRQKYRLLSPLVFPAVIGIIWMYFKPVKVWLETGLTWIDEKMAFLSMHPSASQTPNSQWVNVHATSDVVIWLFIICVGMVLITYLLRGLEYAIFDLQI